MKHHDVSSDVTSLAWVEEFGIGWPAVGACSCAECTGESPADYAASRVSLVSATSALCR
jgi:hypothetical protein